MVSPWRLIWISLMFGYMEQFCIPVGDFYAFFEEMSVQVIDPLLKSVIRFPLLSSPPHFGTSAPCEMRGPPPPFWRAPFPSVAFFLQKVLVWCSPICESLFSLLFFMSNHCQGQRHEAFPLCFLLEVSVFCTKSLIYFDLICMCVVQ